MPPLLVRLVFDALPRRAPWPLRPAAALLAAGVNKRLLGPQLALHFDYWEHSLRESGWFAGAEFSTADVMMSFPLEAAAKRVGLGSRHSASQASSNASMRGPPTAALSSAAVPMILPEAFPSGVAERQPLVDAKCHQGADAA
ncbi:hypothetical protein P7D22_06810 [Lichenihabitans sp. Uapishka_5]|uniref:hypothetical protein n=1 Tax=Lichenihabitans sp. Uapishka_5 TaxID=3037302 RepID=UPI0029E8143E|nr:hypothetical protein [Lichenihabitans sp. Uapishka_5]MDX7950887.1 hypothetical protein [Lichenihabitans sp. Uapishka_5]